MVTKSKSTDAFKGVVSWLCLLVTLCVLTTAVAALVIFVLSLVFNDYEANLIFQALENFYYRKNLTEFAENVLTPAAISLLLFTAAAVLVFAFRPDRRAFEAAVARVLGKIWMEIKLCLIALLLILFFAAFFVAENWPAASASACIPVLLLYFLCLDIGHNKRFFSHNIIHSVLLRVNSYKQFPRFEKRSLRRLYPCLGVTLGVLVFAVLIFAIFNPLIYYHPLMILGFFASVTGAVLGIIWWYTLALKEDLRDWSALMAQIEEMYGGNMDAVNHVPPASNLYDCAMQLNMIRIGIQKAVEEGVKADRTKVELITNVSHDIKTPLTSIVSYIELLKKEPDLPPHVMDYVNTISQKADRLSHIVQDVFEVSKAATGNISLDLEDLDIGKLLQQTFAEMDEAIKASQLVWRVDIPETPVLVHADGQRLYRVFQNLIRNCTQYSLEGSRVYVKLTVRNGAALVSIRNISKAEIAAADEDLTARFVRGDENRTTEGSGLGLSIAKSFTEACGGTFAIPTDGDLFTATVQFPCVDTRY